MAKRSQAPGDATVLKRVSAITPILYVEDRKNSIFGISEFFYVCLPICNFSIFVMVTWPLIGTLQGPIPAKCLVTDSPDQQKAHLESLGFPSVPLVWGKTVYCRLCTGYSKGTLKREKCCFWIWLRARYKNSDFFHYSTRPRLHVDGLPAEFAAIRRLCIGLRVRYKYYKNIVVLDSGLAWSRPRADRGLSRPTSVFRTTIGVCKILSRSVEIWQYEGQKPVYE